MNKQRNPGTWDGETMEISDGTMVKKGSYVMVWEPTWNSFKHLGEVSGVQRRANEPDVVDVRVFGSEEGELYRPYWLRRATYREFRWNRTGFGKTPWIQFYLIAALFTVIGLVGAFSMGDRWWVMPTFYALCWGVVEMETYHNYTRRTV